MQGGNEEDSEQNNTAGLRRVVREDEQPSSQWDVEIGEWVEREKAPATSRRSQAEEEVARLLGLARGHRSSSSSSS
jgi:hypothetical protein